MIIFCSAYALPVKTGNDNDFLARLRILFKMRVPRTKSQNYRTVLLSLLKVILVQDADKSKSRANLNLDVHKDYPPA